MSYVDIGREASSNPAFRDKANALISRLKSLEQSKSTDTKVQRHVAETVRDIYRLCNYNCGLLLPWFFPRAIGNKPMSLSRRRFAFAMYDLNIGGVTTIRGSRQISKSTNLGGRQLVNQHVIPGWRSIYIVPHSKQCETYATRLLELEKSFRYYRRRHSLRQNMYFKEASNRSTVELMHVFASTAHVRGKSTDEIVYDEYQLFDADHEADIEQTQKASKHPTTLYAGTATTIESPLERRFQESSMATWHICAGDGKTWLDCGDKDVALSMIRPFGLTCPITSKPLDVNNGLWVHQNERLRDLGVLGFHVPQIIIPDYAQDIRGWDDIYRTFVKNDIAKFLQEVMGIPVSEGGRELTEEDLKVICILGNRDHVQSRLNHYKFIVSGCDWGGSDWQPAHRTKVSYTVHVMLGVTADGTMDLLHARRYSGMRYEEIAHQIILDHQRLQGTALASDFGVGMAYNEYLRKHINPERHLIFEYVGPTCAIVGKPPYGMHNQFTLNKTEAVSQTIMALKKPRIRSYNWEEARDYLLDCTNSYRVPVEGVHGKSSFRFIRDPKSADDTLHALTFGYTLGRILLGEPLFEDESLRTLIQSRLNVRSPSQFNGLRHYSG